MSNASKVVVPELKASDYSVGLMHEVAQKATKAGFSPDELFRLSTKEFHLIQSIRREEFTFPSWHVVAINALHKALHEKVGIRVRGGWGESWVMTTLRDEWSENDSREVEYKLEGLVSFVPRSMKAPFNERTPLLARYRYYSWEGISRVFSLWVALTEGEGVRRFDFSFSEYDDTIKDISCHESDPEWVTEWLTKHSVIRQP